MELIADVADDLPAHVVGDPGRLRQVLTNLLDNALRFTRAGRVCIGVKLESESADSIDLRFSVRDSGIGISPEKQAVVFEAFMQADGSITREYGGTGLGLGISARLVALMGGAILLESEEGRGSTFQFTARFGVPSAADLSRGCAVVSDSALPMLPPLHILVAEDNHVNRIVTARVLKRAGHSVEITGSGTEALEAIRDAEFDIVLMDVEMPGMGGLEATRRLREIERETGDHLPIVALTAHAMRGDRERCLASGMDGYLSKPIRRSELFNAIAAVVPTKALSAQRGLAEPDSAAESDPRAGTMALFRANCRTELDQIHAAVRARHCERGAIGGTRNGRRSRHRRGQRNHAAGTTTDLDGQQRGSRPRVGGLRCDPPRAEAHGLTAGLSVASPGSWTNPRYHRINRLSLSQRSRCFRRDQKRSLVVRTPSRILLATVLLLPSSLAAQVQLDVLPPILSPEERERVLFGERPGHMAPRRVHPLENQMLSAQDDFDVTHYLLDLNFDEEQETINGSVRITATSLVDGLSHVPLNLLDNMNVTSVTRGLTLLTYLHNGNVVDVLLDQPFDSGQSFQITVFYNGSPTQGWLRCVRLEQILLVGAGRDGLVPLGAVRRPQLVAVQGSAGRQGAGRGALDRPVGLDRHRKRCTAQRASAAWRP